MAENIPFPPPVDIPNTPDAKLALQRALDVRKGIITLNAGTPEESTLNAREWRDGTLLTKDGKKGKTNLVDYLREDAQIQTMLKELVRVGLFKESDLETIGINHKIYLSGEKANLSLYALSHLQKYDAINFIVQKFRNGSLTKAQRELYFKRVFNEVVLQGVHHIDNEDGALPIFSPNDVENCLIIGAHEENAEALLQEGYRPSDRWASRDKSRRQVAAEVTTTPQPDYTRNLEGKMNVLGNKGVKSTPDTDLRVGQAMYNALTPPEHLLEIGRLQVQVDKTTDPTQKEILRKQIVDKRREIYAMLLNGFEVDSYQIGGKNLKEIHQRTAQDRIVDGGKELNKKGGVIDQYRDTSIFEANRASLARVTSEVLGVGEKKVAKVVESLKWSDDRFEKLRNELRKPGYSENYLTDLVYEKLFEEFYDKVKPPAGRKNQPTPDDKTLLKSVFKERYVTEKALRDRFKKAPEQTISQMQNYGIKGLDLLFRRTLPSYRVTEPYDDYVQRLRDRLRDLSEQPPPPPGTPPQPPPAPVPPTTPPRPPTRTTPPTPATPPPAPRPPGAPQPPGVPQPPTAPRPPGAPQPPVAATEATATAPPKVKPTLAFETGLSFSADTSQKVESALAELGISSALLRSPDGKSKEIYVNTLNLKNPTAQQQKALEDLARTLRTEGIGFHVANGSLEVLTGIEGVDGADEIDKNGLDLSMCQFDNLTIKAEGHPLKIDGLRAESLTLQDYSIIYLREPPFGTKVSINTINLEKGSILGIYEPLLKRLQTEGTKFNLDLAAAALMSKTELQAIDAAGNEKTLSGYSNPGQYQIVSENGEYKLKFLTVTPPPQRPTPPPPTAAPSVVTPPPIAPRTPATPPPPTRQPAQPPPPIAQADLITSIPTPPDKIKTAYSPAMMREPLKSETPPTLSEDRIVYGNNWGGVIDGAGGVGGGGGPAADELKKAIDVIIRGGSFSTKDTAGKDFNITTTGLDLDGKTQERAEKDLSGFALNLNRVVRATKRAAALGFGQIYTSQEQKNLFTYLTIGDVEIAVVKKNGAVRLVPNNSVRQMADETNNLDLYLGEREASAKLIEGLITNKFKKEFNVGSVELEDGDRIIFLSDGVAEDLQNIRGNVAADGTITPQKGPDNLMLGLDILGKIDPNTPITDLSQAIFRKLDQAREQTKTQGVEVVRESHTYGKSVRRKIVNLDGLNVVVGGKGPTTDRGYDDGESVLCMEVNIAKKQPPRPPPTPQQPSPSVQPPPVAPRPPPTPPPPHQPPTPPPVGPRLPTMPHPARPPQQPAQPLPPTAAPSVVTPPSTPRQPATPPPPTSPVQPLPVAPRLPPTPPPPTSPTAPSGPTTTPPYVAPQPTVAESTLQPPTIPPGYMPRPQTPTPAQPPTFPPGYNPPGPRTVAPQPPVEEKRSPRVQDLLWARDLARLEAKFKSQKRFAFSKTAEAKLPEQDELVLRQYLYFGDLAAALPADQLELKIKILELAENLQNNQVQLLGKDHLQELEPFKQQMLRAEQRKEIDSTSSLYYLLTDNLSSQQEQNVKDILKGTPPEYFTDANFNFAVANVVLKYGSARQKRLVNQGLAKHFGIEAKLEPAEEISDTERFNSPEWTALHPYLQELSPWNDNIDRNRAIHQNLFDSFQSVGPRINKLLQESKKRGSQPKLTTQLDELKVEIDGFETLARKTQPTELQEVYKTYVNTGENTASGSPEELTDRLTRVRLDQKLEDSTARFLDGLFRVGALHKALSTKKILDKKLLAQFQRLENHPLIGQLPRPTPQVEEPTIVESAPVITVQPTAPVDEVSTVTVADATTPVPKSRINWEDEMVRAYEWQKGHDQMYGVNAPQVSAEALADEKAKRMKSYEEFKKDTIGRGGDFENGVEVMSTFRDVDGNVWAIKPHDGTWIVYDQKKKDWFDEKEWLASQNEPVAEAPIETAQPEPTTALEPAATVVQPPVSVEETTVSTESAPTPVVEPAAAQVEQVPSTVTAPITNFDQAEERFIDLQRRVQRGENISRADYEKMVAELAIRDDRDVLWEINPRTGKWMYFDGAEWMVGRPPGHETPSVIAHQNKKAKPTEAAPTSAPEPTATITTSEPFNHSDVDNLMATLLNQQPQPPVAPTETPPTEVPATVPTPEAFPEMVQEAERIAKHIRATGAGYLDGYIPNDWVRDNDSRLVGASQSQAFAFGQDFSKGEPVIDQLRTFIEEKAYRRISEEAMTYYGGKTGLAILPFKPSYYLTYETREGGFLNKKLVSHKIPSYDRLRIHSLNEGLVTDSVKTTNLQVPLAEGKMVPTDSLLFVVSIPINRRNPERRDDNIEMVFTTDKETAANVKAHALKNPQFLFHLFHSIYPDLTLYSDDAKLPTYDKTKYAVVYPTTELLAIDTTKPEEGDLKVAIPQPLPDFLATVDDNELNQQAIKAAYTILKTPPEKAIDLEIELDINYFKDPRLKNKAELRSILQDVSTSWERLKQISVDDVERELDAGNNYYRNTLEILKRGKADKLGVDPLLITGKLIALLPEGQIFSPDEILAYVLAIGIIEKNG